MRADRGFEGEAGEEEEAESDEATKGKAAACREREILSEIRLGKAHPRRPSPTSPIGPIIKLFHGKFPAPCLPAAEYTLRRGTTWRRRPNPGARTSARPSPTSSAAASSPSRRSPPGAPTPRRAPAPSPAPSSPPRPRLRPPITTKRRTSMMMRRRRSRSTPSPTSLRSHPSSAAPKRAGGSPARSCSRSGWSTPLPTLPATGPSPTFPNSPSD